MSTSTPPLPRSPAPLTAALLLCLTACSSNSTKPSKPSTEPLPPRVDCEQPFADPWPRVPRTSDPVAWATWARTVMGLAKEDRSNRLKEHECVDKLKAAKVIR